MVSLPFGIIRLGNNTVIRISKGEVYTKYTHWIRLLVYGYWIADLDKDQEVTKEPNPEQIESVMKEDFEDLNREEELVSAPEFKW